MGVRPPRWIENVGQIGSLPFPADSEADKRMRGGAYSLIRFARGNPLAGIPQYFRGRNLQRAFVMLRSPPSADDEASDFIWTCESCITDSSFPDGSLRMTSG